MKVYCVLSSTTGIVCVTSNPESAVLACQGAAETHASYLPGRVVRLGRNLESLAPHEFAWHYTLCDQQWKSVATVEISVQDVIKLV